MGNINLDLVHIYILLFLPFFAFVHLMSLLFYFLFFEDHNGIKSLDFLCYPRISISMYTYTMLMLLMLYFIVHVYGYPK